VQSNSSQELVSPGAEEMVPVSKEFLRFVEHLYSKSYIAAHNKILSKVDRDKLKVAIATYVKLRDQMKIQDKL